MTCVALEGDGERARTDDAADDPDIDARPLEYRALLDVQLEVGGERRRIPAGAENAHLGEPQPGELGHEELTATAWRCQIVWGESAGESQAAERADQRPLLVREVDRLERDRQLDLRILHGTEHLERADDAESAVEAPAPPDGVEMGAKEQRPRRGTTGRQDRRVVGGSVDPRFEPGSGCPFAEPGACSEMCVREGLSIDPTVDGRTDSGESVEVGAQAV